MLLVDISQDFVVWTDFLGGFKLADMHPETSPPPRDSKTYHPVDVFSDVLYYHSSRQTKMKGDNNAFSVLSKA